MNTSEIHHLDGKLTDIATLLAETRTHVAILSERSATKQDVGSINPVLQDMHYRLTQVEGAVNQVAEFQKNCPAVNEEAIRKQLREEKVTRRRLLYSAMMSVAALITAAGTLWQSVIAKPQAAIDPTKKPSPAVAPQAPVPVAKPKPPKLIPTP